MNPHITRLRALHRLETEEQAVEYDELLDALADDTPLDPSLLPDLLLSFFDDTEEKEVMWGLIHLVERYPDDLYVSRLVEAAPQMLPRARNWLIVLLRRVLKSGNARSPLREVYCSATPQHQKQIAGFLHEVVQWDSSAAAEVAEVTGP